MSPYLSAHMTAEQEFKNGYAKVLRLAFIVTVVGHLLVFMFGPEFAPAPYQLREKAQFEAVAIPDDFNVPPPPEEKPDFGYFPPQEEEKEVVTVEGRG